MANPPLVELGHISQASFAKLIPFFVVEQSERSCLCVHCYRAKLSAVALRQLWPTFHQGPSPGDACTCTCDLCTGPDGGCAAFLPVSEPDTVFSMGGLSDKLLCEQKFLYTSKAGGKPVTAHTSVCVEGHCVKCKKKRDRFFNCPRHRGDADRPLVRLGLTEPGLRPGEVRWDMFTAVDEGDAPHADQGGEDEDYNDPRGSADKKRKRKVSSRNARPAVRSWWLYLHPSLENVVVSRLSNLVTVS